MLGTVAHAETIKTRPGLRSADALQIRGFVIEQNAGMPWVMHKLL